MEYIYKVVNIPFFEVRAGDYIDLDVIESVHRSGNDEVEIVCNGAIFIGPPDKTIDIVRKFPVAS